MKGPQNPEPSISKSSTPPSLCTRTGQDKRKNEKTRINKSKQRKPKTLWGSGHWKLDGERVVQPRSTSSSYSVFLSVPLGRCWRPLASPVHMGNKERIMYYILYNIFYIPYTIYNILYTIYILNTIYSVLCTKYIIWIIYIVCKIYHVHIASRTEGGRKSRPEMVS